MSRTMSMPEGVIQYHLDYQPTTLVLPPAFAEFNAWRSLLWRLGLIGQDDRRYGGLGYGNLSLRLADGSFLITGTQTGHLAHLEAAHYARVLTAWPEQNRLRAEGPVPPSSEALTHAAVYATSAQVHCVAHVHSPEIWRQATRLGLSSVPADIAYGTPAMAAAVADAVRCQPQQGIIAMCGHEDGLIAWGATPEHSGCLLARYWVCAVAAEQND